MRVVIIGGVAAGMSAAAKLKRESPETTVVVYERDDQVSYGSCGLPYFVAGYNDDWRLLIARTAEAHIAAGIEVRLFHEVTAIDPTNKAITGRRRDTGETFSDTYDRLLIAVGACPVLPSFPGINQPGVHSLRTIADGIALLEDLQRPETREVIIIGGGYIGIELAEAALAQGKKVRCMEAGPQVLMQFEPEIAETAAAALLRHGADIHINEMVTAIHSGSHRLCCVETEVGRYEADLVIMAIGVRPNTAFLADSGVKMAENGAIIVDREQRTNLPDIYATGDCAEVYHALIGENRYLPLATTANKCGRLVAANLLGGNEQFVGTLGSAALKVMDRELARTGLSEAECLELGYDVQCQVVEVPNHPVYYPDQSSLRFKLVADRKTHRLLGAQGSGADGVVLRIDIFAAAITNGMTTEAIGQLDLCYSPPFSSAWDAVLVASNAIKFIE
ncbi:MAG: CoA-disulfide reductase [Ruminococcaceae bacterium]|nr:CoA-disulfide reductase [Oscillospiraceae bacterium]